MPLYSEYRKDMQQAADFILKQIGAQPEIAVVLGSGLSSYADTAFVDRKEINYKDIPHLPTTTVSGHRGKLYYGHIQGKLAICFAGRFHSYEGHAGPIITLLPQLAKALGCKVYILTNAAGGTKPGMRTGCLMSIKDHGATARFNPLFGFEAINAEHMKVSEKDFESKIAASCYPFTTSGQEIYSNELNTLAMKIATDEEFVKKTSFELRGQNRTVELHEGTYVFNSGPNYETHTAVTTLVELAPGSVGMSSVPEALAARMLGLHVYGMSLITNLGAGLSDEVLTHEDVKEVADKVSGAVQELVGSLIKKVDINNLPVLPEWGSVKEDFEMVQHQAAHAKWSEIEKLQFKNAKRCIIYPDCKFELYVEGETLFVSSPKTLDLHQASLVLGACQINGITDIKVVDKTLPKGTMVSASNVINFSGQHLTVGPKAVKQLAKVAGKHLVVVDGCESPETNTLISNFMKKYHIDLATNQHSVYYATLGRLVGMEVVYCSIDQASVALKNEAVPRWEASVEAPNFGVFNVEQIHYAHAEQQAKLLAGLDIARIICYDGCPTCECGKRIEGLEFKAFYCEKSKCLCIESPRLQDNVGLTESALAARVCKFVKAPVLVLTANCNAKQTHIVKDIINITGLNTLRGENDEKYGPRFPDMSQICNQEIAAKLGYEKAVFMLNLEAKYEGSPENIVCGGALQNLLTLVHQKQTICAVVVPSAEAAKEVAEKFLQ